MQKCIFCSSYLTTDKEGVETPLNVVLHDIGKTNVKLPIQYILMISIKCIKICFITFSRWSSSCGKNDSKGQNFMRDCNNPKMRGRGDIQKMA